MPIVGGKNAARGEMYSTLVPKAMEVLNDFSMTAEAYPYFCANRHQSAHAALEIHGIAGKDFASVKACPPSLRPAFKRLPWAWRDELADLSRED